MTTYNTGNPIGSKDPKDLYDNAENLDTAVNDMTNPSWEDRLGRSRKTMSGMEAEFDADQSRRENEFNASQVDKQDRFNNFIASSGYQFLGDYAAGIEITEYNQIIRDGNGEFWRVSGQVDLPYVTTGAGLPEDDALMPLGDAVLRQDLANPNKGAVMVARSNVTFFSVAEMLAMDPASVRDDQTYVVKGYHFSTVIGGGEFYWDATSTAVIDAGNVFGLPDVPVGRLLRRVQGHRFDVVNFGARADGVSDDTEVIRRTIQRARQANGRKVIYFPAFDFLVTETIELATQFTLLGAVPHSLQNTARGSRLVVNSDTWTSGDLQPIFRCTSSGSTQSYVFANLGFHGNKPVPYEALYTSDPLTGVHGIDVSGVRDGVEVSGCCFRGLHTGIVQLNETTSSYLDKVTVSKSYFYRNHRAISLSFGSTAGLSLDNCMVYDCYDWVDAGNSRVFSNATSYNNSSFSHTQCGIKGGLIHAIGNWFEAGNRFFQPSHGLIAESNFLGVAWDAVSPGSTKFVVAPRPGCRYIRITNNQFGSTNRIMADITPENARDLYFELVGNSGISSPFGGGILGGLETTAPRTLGYYAKLGMVYVGHSNNRAELNCKTTDRSPVFGEIPAIGLVSDSIKVANIPRVQAANIYLNNNRLRFKITTVATVSPDFSSERNSYLKIKLLGDRNGSGGGVMYVAYYTFYKVAGFSSWQVVSEGTDPLSWTVEIDQISASEIDVSILQNHAGGASKDKLFFIEATQQIEVTLLPNP